MWDHAREDVGLKDVGLKGKTVHDLRRSFTRMLRDAHVDEQTGMKATGHKTRAMYDRYNIRDERDLQRAARKVSPKWNKKRDVMGQ